MKCNFHPDIDAVGVCTSCGKGLCKECEVELGGKLYCKVCANETFKKLSKPDMEVSGWFYLLPLFFGVFGGIFAFFYNNNFKKNKNRAKNILGFGIIISILWFIPVLLPFRALALR
jgi:ABC-type antimicrobial peptide transport system permease subunit